MDPLGSLRVSWWPGFIYKRASRPTAIVLFEERRTMHINREKKKKEKQHGQISLDDRYYYVGCHIIIG